MLNVSAFSPSASSTRISRPEPVSLSARRLKASAMRPPLNPDGVPRLAGSRADDMRSAWKAASKKLCGLQHPALTSNRIALGKSSRLTACKAVVLPMPDGPVTTPMP